MEIVEIDIQYIKAWIDVENLFIGNICLRN